MDTYNPSHVKGAPVQHTHIHHADRQTDRQTDIPFRKLADRQTDRQTDIPSGNRVACGMSIIYTHIYMCIKTHIIVNMRSINDRA